MAKKKANYAKAEVIPVEFQGFATKGDKSTIGIVISRKKLSPNQASRLFVKNRLTLGLKLDTNTSDDGKDQMTFDKLDGDPIECTADVKGYSEGSHGFRVTLHLAKSEVKGSGLDEFTDQAGKMAILEVSEIPKPEKPEADDPNQGELHDGDEPKED